jgi:hypothetical protein
MGNEKSLPDLITKGKAEKALDGSAEGKAWIALPRLTFFELAPKEGCSGIAVSSPGMENH